MNQLFVGMKKIPVEQGSGYNVAYYILVEEAETEDGVLCDQYGLRVVLLGSEGKHVRQHPADHHLSGQHLSPGAGGHDPLGNPSSFAGRGG